MSSWTKTLLAKLETCGATDQSESAYFYEVLVTTFSDDLWQFLLALSAEEDDFKVKIKVGYDLGDELNLLESHKPDAGQPAKVFVIKNEIKGYLRFFEKRFLIAELKVEPALFEQAHTVLVADIVDGPATLGSKTLTWGNEIPAAVENLIGDSIKSPRQFVNDSTGNGLVPDRLDCWIPVEGRLDLFNEFYGSVAARRFALSLPSALIQSSDKVLTAVTEVKRRVKNPIESGQSDIWSDPALFNDLYAVIVWIFVEGQDAENRHAIVTSELARSMPKDVAWGEGLKQIASTALETAKIAHRLHLYDKSVDALKLMSDLRKGLAEDVKSVSAQTTALSAGLWRDSAVAFGGVAIKAAGGGTPVLLLTSAYLATSCALNTKAAMQAVSAITKNEQIFRKKLYHPVIPEKEYIEISGVRYEEVISDFIAFKQLVYRIYVIGITCLMLYALMSSSDVTSCFSDQFARWFGRLMMPDSTFFSPTACMMHGS